MWIGSDAPLRAESYFVVRRLSGFLLYGPLTDSNLFRDAKSTNPCNSLLFSPGPRPPRAIAGQRHAVIARERLVHRGRYQEQASSALPAKSVAVAPISPPFGMTSRYRFPPNEIFRG